MSRVIAVLVAVALVVGAVIVRSVVLDDDTGAPASGELVIACATELRVACDALDGEVRIEDAEATAAALSSGGTDIDVWITPEPWMAIVDDTRTRAGREPLFADAPAPIASSPLGLVGPAELDGCDWRCIGDRITEGLDVGTRPLTSTIGTLHLATLAGGWFGTSAFATNDFDGAFTSWLGTVADRVQPTRDPVTRLLQSQAFFDAALSYEAEAAAVFDAASEDRRAGLALLYPRPVANLDVVVAGVTGDPGAVTSIARDALGAAGWRPGEIDAPSLPRAGVFVALRELV